MTSDDSNLVKNQHDIDEIDEHDPLEDVKTPEDQDDDFLEGAEKDTDIDRLHKEAYGDDDNDTIADEVNKDEEAIAKDLDPEEQKKSD